MEEELNGSLDARGCVTTGYLRGKVGYPCGTGHGRLARLVLMTIVCSEWWTYNWPARSHILTMKETVADYVLNLLYPWGALLFWHKAFTFAHRRCPTSMAAATRARSIVLRPTTE